VADQGFDLRGWTLSTGGGIIESVEGLGISKKIACFDHIFIKIMHKINRERRIFFRKNSVLGIKNP